MLLHFKMLSSTVARSNFSETLKLGNVSIIANLLFPYECLFVGAVKRKRVESFTPDNVSKSNMKSVGIKGLHFKVAEFIGPANFW